MGPEGVFKVRRQHLQACYLIKDTSVKHNIPCMNGVAVASHDMTMNIIPRRTSCLSCVFPEVPPSAVPTICVTAGILSSTASAIAGLQRSEALKLLTGQGRPNDGLLQSDVWENNFEVFSIKRQQDCTPPGKRRYQFLED